MTKSDPTSCSKPRNPQNSWFSYDDKDHEWPQILVILCACLSSFSFGTFFAWTSPSIPILTSNFSHIEKLSSDEASYLTMIPPVASILTSPIFALIVDEIGRKRIVLFISVPYIVSWILIILAENGWTLYVARFFSGIGDAALFTTLPVYVGEIATPKVRGTWGNLVAMLIYFGQAFINTIGAYCSIRTTAYICIIVPIAHLFLSLLIPESPYFLLMKNRREDARDSLMKLRWNFNVLNELNRLSKDVERQISESGTWRDLFLITANRKAILISIGLRGAQQLSGLGIFSLYTQKFFNLAGGNISTTASSIIFSTTLALLITGFAFVVDKFGRKPMMIVSSLGCGIVMVIEAIYCYISQHTLIDLTNFNWIPLAGMLVYLVISSAGLGILPTLMLGELFSASIKGKALCVTNIVFATYILTISKAFQSLSDKFGLFVPLIIFAGCCFGSVVFSYYCVPETKGKTLEEIQQDLRGEVHTKFSAEKFNVSAV